MRDRQDVPIKDTAVDELLTRLKDDITEPDRRHITFNFLRAVLDSKVQTAVLTIPWTMSAPSWSQMMTKILGTWHEAHISIPPRLPAEEEQVVKATCIYSCKSQV